MMFDYISIMTARLYEIKFYRITTKRNKKIKPYKIIIGSIWLEENGFKDVEEYIKSITVKYRKFKCKCWEISSPMRDFLDYEEVEE